MSGGCYLLLLMITIAGENGGGNNTENLTDSISEGRRLRGFWTKKSPQTYHKKQSTNRTNEERES